MDNKQTKEDLLSELESLTSQVDVPDYRRTSVKWLLKHLKKKNSQHPNFDRIIEICKTLKSMGVSG